MDNQTEVSIKFKNSVTGEKKLQEYAQTLAQIKSVLSSIDKGAVQQMEQTASGTKEISTSAEKMTESFNLAFDYSALRTFARGLSKVVETFSAMVSKSTSFLEDFNLFQVAFRGNYTEATKFVNKLTEMYGLDEDWLIRTTSQFKQLSNAMGLANETGEKLAKLMTEMSIDISSLYNIDVDRAASILQSALAGQTKPVRALGGDITQATLQKTLDQLNIDTQVSQLSYVEKRLLIIISLTRQLSGVTNDWGRTLESPANQIRIMNEQWSRLQRNVGNVFLGLVSKILPYINAVLMVLNEILKVIGKLLGFKVGDFDFFDEDTVGGVEDFGDALDSAADSAKKLKQGLRGFDKLNVITTPTSGSGGAGVSGGGIGGVDSSLLNEFNKAYEEYNKKLSNVKSQATKIRDRIMEWLGFQKHTNEETDETYFTFKKITGGTVLGALAVGGAVYTGVKFIYKTLKRIGLIKSLNLGGGLTGLVKSITKVVEAFKILGASDGIKYLFLESKLGKGVTALSAAFKGLAAAIGVSTGALAAIIAVIVAVIAAFIGVVAAIKHAYETNDEFKNKVDTMVQTVGKLMQDLYNIFVTVSQQIWEVIEPIWGIIEKGVLLFVSDLYDGIVLYASNIIDIITGVARFLDAIINGDFDAAFDALEVMVENIYEAWKKYFDKQKEKFKEFVKTVIEKVKEFIPKMIEKFGKLLEWFEDLPNKFFYFIGLAIGKIWKVITETDWLELGKTILKGIIKGLIDIGYMTLKAAEWVSETYNKLKEKINNINWWELGKQVFNGIINGMFSFGNKIAEWGSSFAKGIKDALGIHSPSQLMIDAKIGDYSLEGILVGMERALPKLKDEAGNIVDTLNQGIKDATIKSEFNYDIPQFNASSLGNDLYNSAKASANGSGSSVNPTIIVQVGDKEIAKQVITNLQDMAKDNGKPIVIGG